MKKLILVVCLSHWFLTAWSQSDVIFADGFAYLDNCSSATPAYCHPAFISTDGIHINEIMHNPHARGIADDAAPVFAWLEIYYKGDTDLDLSSINLKTESAGINNLLPFAFMPNASHLTIWMLPIGSIPADFGLINDLDFSDKQGKLFIDFNGSLSPSGDDVALYQNNTIVAFAAYGEAFNNTSQLETDALAENLWIASERIILDAINPGETLSLVLDGFYDRKQSLMVNNEADYGSVGWQQQSPSVHQQPSNAIQISPPDGSLINSYPLQLTWQSCDDADAYLLELRNTETGDDLLVQRITQMPEYTIEASDIDFDPLYWTVACLYNDQEKSSPFAKPWFIGTGIIAGGGATGHVLAVGHEFQRKDTNMLCLYRFDYNLGNNKGYGCEEEIIHTGGSCNWDAPHAISSAADVRQCGPYGANNCVRASVQMVHQYRSAGTVSINQDYISYLVFNNQKPAGPAKITEPEGDLGAGVGMHINETKTVISSLFAIDENDIEVEDNPSFNDIKLWIDADRPIILWRWSPSGLGHSTVIYGYQTSPQRALFIHDPTLGNITVRFNEYMNKNLSPFIAVKAIVIPATVGTMIGNPPNSIHTHPLAHVFNDGSDVDGVVNFDEIYRFNTAIDNSDSDYDQVNDKQEIHSYTFPQGIGTFSFRNPDIDTDNVRAELDCDADNDSDHDGGEDINGNGGHNELFGVGILETDKFDNVLNNINLALDKAVYKLGEDVRLQGGSLFANTAYKTQSLACPGLSPDAGIAGATFVTNSSGFGDDIVANCGAPGCYKLHLDVAQDEIWQQTSPSGDEIYTCDQVFEYICESCPTDDGKDDELDPDGNSPAVPEPYFDIVTLTNNSLDNLNVVVEFHPGQAGPFPADFFAEIILEIANPVGILPTMPAQTQGGSIWLQLQVPVLGPPIVNVQVWDEILGWQPNPQLLNDFDIQLVPVSIEIVQLHLTSLQPIVIVTDPVQIAGIRIISHVPAQPHLDIMPEPVPLNPGLEFNTFVDLLSCQ